LREFHFETLEDAIRSAGRMIQSHGYSDFQIVGDSDQLLLDQQRILQRYNELQTCPDEPPPEAV